MAHYNVVLEVEIDADSPEEAARKVQDWVQEGDSDWLYYVQHSRSGDVFSVDLSVLAEDAVNEEDNYIPLIS